MITLKEYILENTYDKCANLSDYNITDFKPSKNAASFAYVNYDNDDRYESDSLEKVVNYAKKHIKNEKTTNQDFAIKQYAKGGKELDDLICLYKLDSGYYV